MHELGSGTLSKAGYPVVYSIYTTDLDVFVKSINRTSVPSHTVVSVLAAEDNYFTYLDPAPAESFRNAVDALDAYMVDE